jgi:TonB-dependent starch-binding outer membrane protein SusC
MKHLLMYACLLLFVLGAGSSTLYGQNGSVTGIVKDPAGEEAIGVSVILDGFQLGSVTNIEGRYRIANVPPGKYRIKANYTGYAEFMKDITVAKGQDLEVNFTLQENANLLNEVVVLGYDVQRKRDLVGSVSKVTSEKLNEIPGGSFENALQGKAAGVQIVQSSGIAGAGSVIRIRGVASLSAGGDPLIVVDGIPIFQSNFVTGESGGQNNNPLNSINPTDIESVEILKDASATAMYGSRGANGVVLITTKRGKNGRPSFELSSRFGTSQPTRVVPVMNAAEWIQIRQEAWENDGNTGRAPLPNGLRYEDIQGIDTDWIGQVIGTGVKTDNSLSFSQGNKKVSTYANASYSDAGSYLIGNKFKRLSGRVNVDYRPVPTMTISITSSLARGLNERIAQAWAGGLGKAQTEALPIYPINTGPQYRRGSPLYSETPGFYNIYNNPVAQRDLTDNHVRELRSINNLSVSWQPTKQWTLTAKANYEYAQINEHTWEDALWTNNKALAKVKYNYVNNRSGFMTANYEVPFANTKHSLRVLGGTEYQRVDQTQREQEFRDLAQLVYRSSAQDTIAAEKTKDEPRDIDQWNFFSMFGKLTYNYDGKYLATVSFRRDGSSKFGANNRFGNFPAVGVGYIVSQEDFLLDNRVINYLKIKGSWGLTGNSDINWRSQFPQYTFGPFAGNQAYGGQPVRYQNKLPNPDLRWETSTTIDAGFELGLFRDRITTEFTFYNKRSTGVFIDIAAAFSSGIPGIDSRYKETQNVATIQNRGIEWGLKTQNIVRPKFYWSTELNFSLNRNKIVDVGNATPDALDGGFGDTRVVVGETFQNNYIIKWLGVDPQTGRPIYESINSETGARGITNVYDVTTNRQVLGNAQPKFIGSVGNELRLGKNLSMNMLWVFVVGGEIYDDAAKRQLGVVTDWNMRRDIFDRWQKPGDVATYPRLTMDMRNWGGNANFWQNNHSLWLSDGSYARLRTLTFNYTVPLQSKYVRALRVFATGGNLITLTNFTGWDPEIARDRTSNQQRNLGGTNLTYLTPPQEKSYTVGLNVQF